MPAGSTYTPLATTTLGSDTADITFSSISGSYTDLVVIGNVGASTTDSAVTLRLNSDSGSNYSFTNIYGNGTSAASSRSTATAAYLAWFVCPIAAIEHNVVAHIMNYSNTTTFKTVISRANRASSGSFPGTESIVSLWRSTAAITTIRIAGGGNLKAGTTFTLYGIAAA